MTRWFSKKKPQPASTASQAAEPAVEPQHTAAQLLQKQANEFRSGGHLNAALEKYHAATAIDPDYMPAWLGAGLVQFDIQNYVAALKCFDEARRIQPAAIDPLYFQGQICERLDDLPGALHRYQQALAIDVTFLPALQALTPIALRLDQMELVERLLKSALLLRPLEPELHLLLGITLTVSGRALPSLGEFDVVLDAQPNRLEALINKAEALCNLERVDEALTIVDCLNELAPNLPEVMLTAARVLLQAGLTAAASTKAEQLLEIQPSSAPAEFVLGSVCWSSSDSAGARYHWQRTIDLDPNFADGALWLAILLFFERDYEAAWPAFEARLASPSVRSSPDGQLLRRLAAGTRWSGDPDLSGTLYVWAEQGFGDTLMLLPLLASAARHFEGQVYFYCPPALLRLAGQIIAPKFLLADRSALPDAALHCPLFSLPAVLQKATTEVFRPSPRAAYLHAPAAAVRKFRDRLDQLTGFKIGIVWNGAGGYKLNSLRSVQLSNFTAIARLTGVTLVSLQKDPPAADLANCAFRLVDWTKDIDDFGDTAALMEGLDLVISIDSAPAHLAGALGVPVWLLNRHNGEWRWGRGRSDNDWYQSMRVFYQTKRGDWDAVFEAMALELSGRLHPT